MNDSLFWLELYCHVTQSSLDSCLCDSLDDAETVADHLILAPSNCTTKLSRPLYPADE